MTTLPVFTSRTLLGVYPVVYLVTGVPAQPLLDSLVANPAEVAAIFHVPLLALLGKSEQLTLQHEHWDMVWLSDRLYRVSLRHMLPTSIC